MLKEKYQIVKTFVKEHKKELLIGAGLVVGTITALYMSEKVEEKEEKTLTSNIEDEYVTAYNKAAEIANETLIPEINAKYDEYDFSNIENDPEMKMIYDQYIEEYENKFNDLVKSLM
jgi:hypothetical protein